MNKFWIFPVLLFFTSAASGFQPAEWRSVGEAAIESNQGVISGTGQMIRDFNDTNPRNFSFRVSGTGKIALKQDYRPVLVVSSNKDTVSAGEESFDVERSSRQLLLEFDWNRSSLDSVSVNGDIRDVDRGLRNSGLAVDRLRIYRNSDQGYLRVSHVEMGGDTGFESDSNKAGTGLDENDQVRDNVNRTDRKNRQNEQSTGEIGSEKFFSEILDSLKNLF